jgi:hypothetical protein
MLDMRRPFRLAGLVDQPHHDDFLLVAGALQRALLMHNVEAGLHRCNRLVNAGRSGGHMMSECECARAHAVVTAAGGGATKPSLMKREK